MKKRVVVLVACLAMMLSSCGNSDSDTKTRSRKNDKAAQRYEQPSKIPTDSGVAATSDLAVETMIPDGTASDMPNSESEEEMVTEDVSSLPSEHNDDSGSPVVLESPNVPSTLPKTDTSYGYPAGTILDDGDVAGEEGSFFQAYEITVGDSVYHRINGRSYRENPDISLSQLRYLKLLHYNFNHEIQVGEMIVNAAICDQAIQVFWELYDMQYEIESMYLVDNYWTGEGVDSDEASMEANNTSCFNYRPVSGSSSLSKHALGRAIDINPKNNPYIRYRNGTQIVQPYNATQDDIDRTGASHQIMKGDDCYQVFIRHGFEWGGNWNSVVDYQHFQLAN